MEPRADKALKIASRLTIALAVLAVLPSLWLPYGLMSEGDALDYRLPILKWMVRHRAYPNWPWTYADDFPMLGELLMLPFFLVKQEAARIVSIAAFFGVGIISAKIGCEFVQDKEKKRAAFLFLLASVLGFQPILLQANQLMVDNVAVFFVLCSLFFLLRDRCVHSGLFMACALATRYTLWGAFPGMLAALLYLKRGDAFKWRDAAVFCALAMLGAGPFMARNFYLNHNPFFPLLSELFSGKPFGSLDFTGRGDDITGRGKGLIALLLFPYDLLITNTFINEIFDTKTAPTGFFSHRVGFLFYFQLGALALAFASAPQKIGMMFSKTYSQFRKVRGIGLLWLALFAFWWVGAQNLRYLACALVLLQLAVLVPVAQRCSPWILSVLCLISGTSISLVHGGSWKIALGWEESFASTSYVQSARSCFQRSGISPESLVAFVSRDSLNGYFDYEFVWLAPNSLYVSQAKVPDPVPDFIFSGLEMPSRPGFVPWPREKPCLLKKESAIR